MRLDLSFSNYGSLLDSIPLFLIAIFFIIVGVIALIALVLYLLQSYGIYKMANNLNVENSWLSFIPIFNLYIIGKIVPTIEIGSKKIDNMEMVLPWCSVICIVLGLIPFIGIIISFIPAILFFYVSYFLYKKYNPDSAKLMIIISIFLPFMTPIFIFVLRNKPPVEPKSSPILPIM